MKVTPELETSVKTINELLKQAEDDLLADKNKKNKNDIAAEIEEISDVSSDTIVNKTGLTTNQSRLLYLLSLYSKTSKNNIQKEVWIRHQPLMILIYEGIILQIFDYDYAPSFQFIAPSVKRNFNLSQEGLSDLDYLREEEYVNSLTLTTANFRTTKSYQISEKGELLIDSISRNDREAVHEVVYAPGTHNLLIVKYIEAKADFILEELLDVKQVEQQVERSNSNIVQVYSRKSSVLETEDVSYVSSAYIPQCLRGNGRPTYSNAHRSHECSQGSLKLKDDLDEVISLSSVSLFVAEYVPMGPNNLVTINCNLSSVERVSGGFFSKDEDEAPLNTLLEISPGLTNINVLDFVPSEFINIEADIHFPIEEGIVQVETFGVSLSYTGAAFCGMQVEAVGDKIKDNISLDVLARLLIDVHSDSSEILDSIMSRHQRELLDFMFNKQRGSRDKITVLVANEIVPQLSASAYRDKGDFENELKQVIGEVRGAYDISELDVLFFGSNGLLLAGPNCRHHEVLLCSYLELNAVDKFIQAFFTRLFFLVTEIRGLRSLIADAERDPNSPTVIRNLLAGTGEQISQLDEILGMLQEGLTEFKLPQMPADEPGRKLFQHLELDRIKSRLKQRANDLSKNVSSTRKHFEILTQSAELLRQQKLIRVTENLISSVDSKLIQAQELGEKILQLIHLCVFIFGALFAFAFLDRLTGSWTVVNSNWMHSFAEVIILETPMLWFFISLGTAGLVLFLLSRRFTVLLSKSRGLVHLKILLNQKISAEGMEKFIQEKRRFLVSQERSFSENKVLSVFCWLEPRTKEILGPVKVTVEYDSMNGILYALQIQFNQQETGVEISQSLIKDKILLDLQAAEVLVPLKTY